MVAPLSTVSNWVNEIDKWAPELGCVLYHGNKDDRAMIRSKSFKKVKKGQISVGEYIQLTILNQHRLTY